MKGVCYWLWVLSIEKEVIEYGGMMEGVSYCVRTILILGKFLSIE